MPAWLRFGSRTAAAQVLILASWHPQRSLRKFFRTLMLQDIDAHGIQGAVPGEAIGSSSPIAALRPHSPKGIRRDRQDMAHAEALATAVQQPRPEP